MIYLEPLDLLILFIIAVVGLVTWQGIRVRELAIAAVRKHLSELNLQLLDQSVAFAGIKPFISPSPGWHRKYRFEFSATGEERYNGCITFAGHKITGIELDAHKIPGTSEPYSNL